MSLEYLEILENRVQEMIELVKHLKEKNSAVEDELSQQRADFHALQQERGQLQEERGEVRQRVEKILGTLKHLDGMEERPSMEQESEQETPG